MTERRPLRVAIVGSGPAGLYAAGHLLSGPHGTYLDGRIVDLHGYPVEVDVFDRLPTPWGLVRGGVAPDHPEKKLISRVFDAIAARRGYRFFGNVEVGRDVSSQQLADWYDAVIYAVGAAGDVRMDIPGEMLAGSHSAREFVAWYNGHPDAADLQFDLSTDRAVVVGNGNVALDIARILTLPHDERRRTDISDLALEALRNSTIREVVVLGRRGLMNAAFNNPELEEIGLIKDVDIVIEGDDLGAPTGCNQANDRMLATLAGYARRPQRPDAKRIVLRFLASPVALHGHDRVESVVIARNELDADASGVARARATDDLHTLTTGLVLRAVGYRGVRVAGLPFDEQAGVVPNTCGRVDGVSGAYVTGWIKRGPRGIIGTNKKCARDTVRALLHDYGAGRLPTEGTLSGAEAAARLTELQPQVVSGEQWKTIDRHERSIGAIAGRPRVKVTNRSELLRIANCSWPPT